jgi:hypothetical protein
MYRDNAAPPTEQLATIPVSTNRGDRNRVVIALVVLAGALWLPALLTMSLARLALPMAIAGVLVACAAVAIQRRRRRRLVITRAGDRHQLVVVDENIELEFPLTLAGDQTTRGVRGIFVHVVRLRLVDARQRAIVVTELREDPQAGWRDDRDLDAEGAVAFLAGRVGACAELRGRVMAINARYAALA